MRHLLRFFFVAVVLLTSASTVAEVMHSSASGFELKSSVSIPASPQLAYEQFVRINEWWSPEHTYWGKSSNLSLEPRAGGCFCEVDGDKSVLHMTVSFVSPNREVRMLGGLGPLQQMGLSGVLTFKFIPVSDNDTRIVQVYRVTGYDPNGLEALAPVVDQVQTLQLKSLAKQFKSRF